MRGTRPPAAYPPGMVQEGIGQGEAGEPAMRVGVAGWAYDDWNGPVYPRPRPRGFSPLAFVARYVDVIEVNSTFYAIPDPLHAARWAETAAPVPGFCFTAKLHRSFTHEAGGLDETMVARFRGGLAPLEQAGVLAALLAQFPVTFTRSEANRARIAVLAERFASPPLVVELRHRSWFTPAAQAELEGLGTSIAAIDLPEAADHPPHGHLRTGPVAYVRLHGRNARTWFDRGAGRDQRYDYLYAETELESIGRRVRAAAKGARGGYVIANNHFRGQALANAIELKARLHGEVPLAPASLVEAYPRLRAQVRCEGQLGLF